MKHLFKKYSILTNKLHRSLVTVAIITVVMILGFTGCISAGSNEKETANVDVIVYQSNFSSGIDQWNARGGEEKLTVTPDGLLYISNRHKTWHGPIRQMQDIFTAGKTYHIVVPVKYTEGNAKQTLILSIQQPQEDGTTTYTNLATAELTKDTWQEFSIEYTVPANAASYPVSLYCETPWKADDKTTAADTFSFYMGNMVITTKTQQSAQKNIPSLSKFCSFPIGAAVTYESLQKESSLNELLRHFDVLTYENDMKQDATEPQEGVFNFSHTDALIKYASENHKKLRGHTLVWHQQVPAWYFEGSGANGVATKEELYGHMKNHITTLVSRYKGRVASWDVVNECIEEDGSLRNSKYLQIAGSEEYIANAFRWAKEADPKAKLFLNDYSIEYAGAKQDGFYALVKRLLSQQVPIDGIGLQCHISQNYPSVSQIQKSIQRFAELGLIVQITELDISVYNSSTEKQKAPTEELLAAQAYRFKELFSMFEEEYKAKHLAMVVTWGLSDGTSWLNNHPVKGRNDYPLFFDGDLQAKYSYWIFADSTKVPKVVKEELDLSAVPSVTAHKGTPLIGKDDPIWNKVPATPLAVQTEGTTENGSSFKVLWDEHALYVQVSVKDAVLNDASPNAYEQDSVEIFIDQNNARTASYESDDAQYRVNYKNVQSFNGGNEKLFKSEAKQTKDGYIIEAVCPLDAITPNAGTVIGFDVQINEANATGTRTGVRNWCNGTNQGYRDTRGFGKAELAK